MKAPVACAWLVYGLLPPTIPLKWHLSGSNEQNSVTTFCHPFCNSLSLWARCVIVGASVSIFRNGRRKQTFGKFFMCPTFWQHLTLSSEHSRTLEILSLVKKGQRCNLTLKLTDFPISLLKWRKCGMLTCQEHILGFHINFRNGCLKFSVASLHGCHLCLILYSKRNFSWNFLQHVTYFMHLLFPC